VTQGAGQVPAAEVTTMFELALAVTPLDVTATVAVYVPKLLIG